MVEHIPVSLPQIHVESEECEFNIKLQSAANMPLSYGKPFVTKMYVEFV